MGARHKHGSVQLRRALGISAQNPDLISRSQCDDRGCGPAHRLLRKPRQEMVQGHLAHELQDQIWAPGPCAFLDATRLLQEKGCDTDSSSSFPSCLRTQDPDLQMTEVPFQWRDTHLDNHQLHYKDGSGIIPVAPLLCVI